MSDIGSLGTPDPSVVEVSEEMPEVTQEATRDEAPKLKKAKNKISPSTKSKFAHLLVESDEEETPEELVNEEYLNMLHERHLQYEKEIARKKLSTPSFAKVSIPEVPAVAAELFQNFESKPLDEKGAAIQEVQRRTKRIPREFKTRQLGQRKGHH